MTPEKQTSERQSNKSPAALLANWISGFSAMAWGCIAMLTAYPFLTNAVTVLVAFPQDVELALWSLSKAILFGAALCGMVWAFRVKYRRERQAIAAQPAGVAAADNSDESPSSGRMLAHCLAHGVWTFFYALSALYYLSNAESTSEINTWGVRLLVVLTVGLLGSFCIQLSWWGTQRLATVKFWGSWLVVNTACAVVGIPIAMLFVSR